MSDANLSWDDRQSGQRLSLNNVKLNTGALTPGKPIDMEMEVRHAEQKHRRGGGRTKGPAPFEDDDRERFVSSLERVLSTPR